VECLMFVPNCVRSLFVPPASEDIQSLEDFIYEYGQAVRNIPQLFSRLAFKTRTLEQELQEVRDVSFSSIGETFALVCRL